MTAALLTAAAGCQRNANVDPVVAEMARTFNFPRTSNDFRIKGARGEGRTLILEIEIAGDMARILGAREAAATFANALCANPETADFLTEGRTLRVDASIGGSRTNASVDYCTGPRGQGVNINTYAQSYRTMIGRDLGDGMRMTSVRVEGQTVVVVIDGRPGFRSGLSTEAVTGEFLSGVCEPGADTSFFDGTRTMRLDTTEAGRDLRQGALITGCPSR